MFFKKLFFSFLFLETCILQAQNYVVSGYIFAKDSHEPLSGSTCMEISRNVGSLSNSSGYYSLTLPKGKVKIKASYVGFNPDTVQFNLQRDTTINFYISNYNLKEVVIYGNKEPIQKEVLLGISSIPIRRIIATPSFAGEPDLIKALTILPGVAAGREGYSDIYVRGGDRGQNLILLDGAKIYNTNHVGGLLSLFNTDAIKSIDFYKSGFPAHFGGRASSVIDIQTRDGNKKELCGKFKLGVLQSGFLLEGPIKKDTSSFLIAFRTSYATWLYKQLKKYLDLEEDQFWSYRFYDLNAKVNYQINNKKKIYCNLYSGADHEKDKSTLGEISDERMNLNTLCITAGENITVTPRLFLKSSISYSGYSNTAYSFLSSGYGNDLVSSMFRNKSYIGEVSGNFTTDFYVSHKHTFTSGMEINKYYFTPGAFHTIYIDSLSKSVTDTITGYKTGSKSFETAFFAEDEISLSDKIKTNAGFRFVYYNFKNTTSFVFEPRFSLRIMLNKNISAKICYTRMNQFNHTLASYYGGMDKEVWFAATDTFPAERADQVSAGVFGEISNFNLECSIEAFYKSMSNLIYYTQPLKEYTDFSKLSEYIQTGGKGEVYGFELCVQRTEPPVTGSISYTLSWNTRQFNNLNGGKRFPFKYDRRHNLNINTRIRFSNNLHLNTTFILMSGAPYTLPVSYFPGNDIYEGYYIYSGINNVRLPIYHRLDFGLEKTGVTKNGNKKTVTINIYNAYARQNASYVYMSTSGKVKQVSLFSIIPSISYSIEF
jgi:hypothetical protein